MKDSQCSYGVPYMGMVLWGRILVLVESCARGSVNVGFPVCEGFPCACGVSHVRGRRCAPSTHIG